MTEAKCWQEMAGLISACCPNLAALHMKSHSYVHVPSAFVRELTLPCLSTLELEGGLVDSMAAMMSAIGCQSSLERLLLDEVKVCVCV